MCPSATEDKARAKVEVRSEVTAHPPVRNPGSPVRRFVVVAGCGGSGGPAPHLTGVQANHLLVHIRPNADFENCGPIMAAGVA